MKRDFDNFHAIFKPIYVCQFYNLATSSKSSITYGYVYVSNRCFLPTRKLNSTHLLIVHSLPHFVHVSMICTIYHQDQQLQQFPTLAGVGQLAVLCIHLIDAYSWEKLKILRDKSETVLNATKKRSTFRTLSHPFLH